MGRKQERAVQEWLEYVGHVHVCVCVCVCVLFAVSPLKSKYLRTLAFESQEYIMPDCNAFSLPSTINSNSQPYSRSIRSFPSLAKDEAKGIQQQSAVNVSNAVTGLQKMQL